MELSLNYRAKKAIVDIHEAIRTRIIDPSIPPFALFER